MKSLLDFINESNKEQFIDGEFSPEELFQHFDVDGDGKVTVEDYAAKILFHAARPEFIAKIIEQLNIKQLEHASGKVLKEDSIQELLDENKTELAEELPNHLLEAKIKKETLRNPPTMLVMRRISIRQFPRGGYVALYYIDALNKYVTIPLDNSSVATVV